MSLIMKQQHFIWLIGSLLVAGCGEEPEQKQDAVNQKASALVTLKHPLEGVKLVNGQVPGIDIHKSPQGYKYAFGETTTGLKNGKINHVSGIVELPTSKIDYQKPENIKKERVFLPLQKKDRIHHALQDKMSKSTLSELIPVRIGIKGGETEEHLFIKKKQRSCAGLRK